MSPERRKPPLIKATPEQVAQKEMGWIEKKLRRLKRHETDFHSDEVDRAIASLHGVIDPHFPWLSANGVVVAYHGSLQYHDPVHLDVDVSFVTQAMPWEAFRHRDNAIETALTKPGAWPRLFAITDLSYASIEEIRTEAIEFANQPLSEEGDSFLDEIASFVLSSRLLYPQQEELFHSFQTQIWTMLPQSRYLRRGINRSLRETIHNRRERRGLGSDF